MAIVKQGSTTLNAGAKGDKGEKGDAGADSNVNKVGITNLSELQALTANKIASIQGNIDLGTTTVNIPSGVILKFEGGKIINGTLNGDYHISHNDLTQIFDLDVILTGDFTIESIRPEWFGGGTNAPENILYWRKCNEVLTTTGGGTLIASGYYEFANEAADGQWDNYGQDGGREAIIHWGASNVNIIIEPQATLKVSGSFITTSTNPCRLITFANCENIHITGGGNIIGNRSEIGENDFDFAITVYGNSENIKITNLKISYFPADFFKPQIEVNYQGETPQTWESGGFDAFGDVEVDPNRIRSTVVYPLTRSRMVENGYFIATDIDSYTQQEAPDGYYNVFFYDINDNFISALTEQQMYERIYFPVNATYAKVSLDTDDLARQWDLDLLAYEVPRYIWIENNLINYMGRQGISVTGMQDSRIVNNVCHDVAGNPGAFIDFEDGRYINRRIKVIGNTSWNVKRHIILYNSVDVTISGNSFLRNRNGDGRVQGVVVAEDGGRISITDNYFENTINQSTLNTEFINNTFVRSNLEVYGGVVDGALMKNSTLITKAVLSGNFLRINSSISVSNVKMINDEQKASTTNNNSIICADKHIMQPYIKLENILIRGVDNGDSLVVGKDVVLDKIEFQGVSNTRIETAYVTNLKSDSPIFIWGTLDPSQIVKYKNFTLTGSAYIRLRSTTDSTNGYVFENFDIESNNITSLPAIDADNALGSLIIKNSSIIDRSTTGTGWSVINFDNTVDKFRMLNTEVVTATAGNLLDKGTSTEDTTWLYKDNIFTNVILNNALGTELNNFEE